MTVYVGLEYESMFASGGAYVPEKVFNNRDTMLKWVNEKGHDRIYYACELIEN